MQPEPVALLIDLPRSIKNVLMKHSDLKDRENKTLVILLELEGTAEEV